MPHSVQDIFGKQEFVQSLKIKDYQEAKLLKHKYLNRYAQMISAAKRQIRSNRSKEDQLIDCGLMLRQFNEQEPLTDDSWNSDVLESKLEELWGPKIAHFKKIVYSLSLILFLNLSSVSLFHILISGRYL
ncbi:MAG: hypothetical protein ACJ0DI_09625 [bacterium]